MPDDRRCEGDRLNHAVGTILITGSTGTG
eukprot:SAG31_NODE_32000_length_361_cov_0.854962_1_plen_28_part_01